MGDYEVRKIGISNTNIDYVDEQLEKLQDKLYYDYNIPSNIYYVPENGYYLHWDTLKKEDNRIEGIIRQILKDVGYGVVKEQVNAKTKGGTPVTRTIIELEKPLAFYDERLKPF